MPPHKPPARHAGHAPYSHSLFDVGELPGKYPGQKIVRR